MKIYEKIEKTLTFTVEDALLSPISFAMLSGAGVVKGGAFPGSTGYNDEVRFHQTTRAYVEEVATGESTSNVIIDLGDALSGTEIIDETAPIFVALVDSHNDLTGKVIMGSSKLGVEVSSQDLIAGTHTYRAGTFLRLDGIDAADQSRFIPGVVVIVDYYVKKLARTVTELQVDAENFGGYYYVEADTLFRRESDGKDLPVNITIPKVKIQSNFTFSMASSGDPSTFSFTMDAMPDYTYFDKTKKVLCAMQILDDVDSASKDAKTVFSATTKSEALD